MNDPKPRRHPWRWEMLHQDGRVWLMIFQVAHGDRTFLAYSGIGDCESVHDLTVIALETMVSISGDQVLIDLQYGTKPARRVSCAFKVVKDNGSVIFLSPTDGKAAAVLEEISKGKPMEPIA